ncbi:MAG: hypothetical protein KJO31_17400 [Gammaproteobacteria bacterium]|nr:hypothetical protein [Gammaproteobacteria bacterium]
MSIGNLRDDWALAIAIPLLAIVGLIVLWQLFQRSPRGQLRANIANVAHRRREHKKAAAAVRKAESRLEKMRERAESTRPRLVQEAKEKLADARALQKVSQDQILVAENHLRRVIYEEFPPRDQEALRHRHLPSDEPSTIPFSFEE